ncbi:MAG TPA: choice-of-anchor D domain-containing protein [Ignavibacteriaceae bacterium]|nr:choice-of-anchor D domain-containing protein [Ignavibacteriaceae bacterium]
MRDKERYLPFDRSWLIKGIPLLLILVLMLSPLSYPQITPVWEQTVAGTNLPAWFGTSTERGLAYGNVGGNDRLYVVSTKTTPPSIIIINAATGDSVGTLSTTGVAGGFTLLNDVEVSADGQIYACNMTTSASTDAFKVYKWTSESADPVVVLTFNAQAYRLGDKFTVVGSAADNSLTIYAARASNAANVVIRFTTTDNGATFTATEVPLTFVTASLSWPKVYPITTGVSDFFYNGVSLMPSEFGSDGTYRAQMFTNAVTTGSHAQKYFTYGGKKYLAVWVYGTSGANHVRVTDITSGVALGTLLESTTIMGTTSSSGYGDMDIKDNGGGIYTIYVLTANNGIGAYTFNVAGYNINLAPPFTQDFEGTFPPANYLRLNGYLTNSTYFRATSSSWMQDDFGNVTDPVNKAARVNIYGTTRRDWLITPTINIGSLEASVNYQLEFDLALTTYGTTNATTMGDDDTMAVVISTDNGATWSNANILKAYTSTSVISNTGQHEVISLAGYSGMIRIGFYGASSVSNTDNDLFVDNIKVVEASASPVVTVNPTEKEFGELQIGTSSTAQTFSISNTGGGTLTISGIAKAGTDPAHFTLTDANVYPVNLTTGQSITIQVAFAPTTVGAKTANIAITHNLTDGVSNIPVTGTGIDATVNSFPYTQNFDGVTFPPSGWVNQQVTGTGLFKRVLGGTNPAVLPKNDSAMVQYNAYNYTTGTTAILVTPPLNIPTTEADYRVKFWMYRDAGYLTNLDRIAVFVNGSPSLTGADSIGNIFRSKNLEPVVADTGWYEYTFNLPGSPAEAIKYVIFKGVSGYGNNVYIDGVTIEAAPTSVVTWANLQWPPTATIQQGETATVYAQAWIDGVTSVPGVTPGLDCWIGINNADTDPSTWTTWVPATYNVDAGNNDEFMANIGATLPVGTYYYAARWQYLGGPYRYGGYNSGFWNGTTNVSGVLTVNPFVANLPLVEGFEDATFPPTGWNVIAVNGLPTWTRGTTMPNTGLGHAMYSYSTTLPGNDWLVTPGLNLQSGKSYKLTYWYKVHSGSYPENLKVAIGSLANPDSLITVLADHPGIVNVAYMPNTVIITPASTGTYFIGFHAYSLADQWNIYLDDIEVSEVPEHDYAVVELNQENAVPDPFKVKFEGSKTDEFELPIKIDGLTGVKQSEVNNSGNVRFGNPSDEIEGIKPISLKAIIQNQGTLSSPFDFNYKFNGVAGTVVNRPGVPFLETDTLTLTPAVTTRGTFTTQAYITSTSDTLKDNDTLVNNKTLVYPEPMIRVKYDNGSNTVPTFVGFGTNNLPLTAAVRFTSGAEMRLASIDAFYRNELDGDSITVTVYAAGETTTAPGVVLYTKKFAGVNYLNPGDAGDYVTLPLGNDAPIFTEGMDFWVGITFNSAIQFPMGIHNTGFTPGRSYLTDGSGTWFPLVITTERAWLLRVVGVPYVPPMYNTIWQRSVAQGNLPSWFGTHLERGLTYGNTLPGIEGNDRIYVVSRTGGTFVKILDASNGNDLGNLSTTGIAGGTYLLNDVEATKDGKILAANLILNASTDTFRVYMWDNESALPVPVIKFRGTDAVRLGDKITVTGDYSLGTAVLYAGSATAGQMKVYKFTMSGGVFNQVPEVIALSDNAAGTPTSASIAPLPNGDFYWKATGFSVKKYSATGQLLGTIPGTVVATGSNAIRYIGTLIDQEYIIVYQYGSGNENARIVKVPVSDVAAATTYDITPTLGNVANTNGSGDVSFKVNHDGSVDIIVLGTNNGIGVYRTIQPVPVELTSFTATSQDNHVYLNWSTATESNSKEFLVERNTGSNWAVIGSVEAAGTSTDIRSYSFVDKSVTTQSVIYRLKMVDIDGTFNYSKEIKVEMGVPSSFSLSQNYPNPFNPSTRIDYQIPSDANVTIELFDVTGQKIATMMNKEMKAGYHSFDLEAGKFGMATGVYIYRLVAIDKTSGESFVDSKKLMMLK